MTERIRGIVSRFQSKIFFILVIMVFVSMLVLNLLTPLITDDYTYHGATSPWDALRREYVHYMIWSGRSVAHFIIRVFLMMPKSVFDIFNALVFSALTLFIYRISDPRTKNNILLYLFIFVSLWLYTARFGQVILWLTGSVNYLWGAFFILGFLLPYNIHFFKGKVFRSGGLPIVGMFLLGLLAGWCNENTSATMIMLALFFVVYGKVMKEKTQLWMIGGIAGSVMGYLLMILAPGNNMRAQSMYQRQDPLASVLLWRIQSISTWLQEHIMMLGIIFFILLLMQMVLCTNPKRTLLAVVYFAAALITAYAMVLSPTAPDRSFFGSIVFMIIACGHLLGGLDFDLKSIKIATVSMVCILCFQFTFSFIDAFIDIARTKHNHLSMERFIENEIAQGKKDIEIPSGIVAIPEGLSPYNAGYIVPIGPTGDPDYLDNKNIAKMYGIDSIRIR